MSADTAIAPPTAILRWATGAAIFGALALTAGAFKLSFDSLSALARMAGIVAHDSWIWPVIIDGLIVVATLAILALAGHGRRALAYPWTLLFSGAVASVAANAEHAQLTHLPGVSGAVAMTIAAVPPIVMLASTHLAVALIQRASRAASAARAVVVVPAPAATPASHRLEAPVASQPARQAAPAAPTATRTAPASKPASSGKVTQEVIDAVRAMRGEPDQDGRYAVSEAKIADHFGLPKSRVHQIITTAAAEAPHIALSVVHAIA
ncbi:MAG: DUF2637 domain-containing protein [Cellulomonas sp.]|nr:DUF2637 domain-containing protein [Cellulomonas sp.]